MAELVDAHDSKSCGAIHESSILSRGTHQDHLHMIMYSVLLAGTAIISVLLIYSNSPALSAVLWILLAGLFYIHLEPYFLKVRKFNHKIPGLKTPIKIAFIADLQTKKLKGKKFLHRVIKKINNLKPDLVFIGGDLISNEYFFDDSQIKSLAEFSVLSKNLPVYAVLGNHEYGIDFDEKKDQPHKIFSDRHGTVVDALKNLGISVLHNSFANISVRGQNLELYGTDDLWAENTSWENIKSAKNNLPLLVLTHNPDTILSYPKKIKKPSLVLAGHTHGGQIRLPFFGPVGNAKLKLGKKYYDGFFNWHGISLFVTHGLGESLFAIRFLTPPEIVEVTLLPEA